MIPEEVFAVAQATEQLYQRLDFNARVHRGAFYDLVSEVSGLPVSNQLRIAARLVLLAHDVVEVSHNGKRSFVNAHAKRKQRNPAYLSG